MNKKIIVSISLFIFSFILFSFSFNNLQKAKIVENKNEKLEKNVNSKEEEIKKIRNIVSKKDPSISGNSVINKFFNIYYNYSNHSEYINRKNLSKSIVSEDVLNKNNFFGDDTDSSGNSVIDVQKRVTMLDSTSIYPTFLNESKYEALVLVKFSAEIDSQGSMPIYHLYKVTYEDNKLTQVDFLGQQKLMSSSLIN